MDVNELMRAFMQINRFAIARATTSIELTDPEKWSFPLKTEWSVFASSNSQQKTVVITPWQFTRYKNNIELCVT